MVSTTRMSTAQGDWRASLQPEARLKIVNKIMETLKRHLPFSSQEGIEELKKIAMRLEEKIFTSATSQPDYLKKISLKMLTMESNSQNAMPNSFPPNSIGNNSGPSNPGGVEMMQERFAKLLLGEDMSGGVAAAKEFVLH